MDDLNDTGGIVSPLEGGRPHRCWRDRTIDVQ
jgi:hypothetical protein